MLNKYSPLLNFGVQTLDIIIFKTLHLGYKIKQTSKQKTNKQKNPRGGIY